MAFGPAPENAWSTFDRVHAKGSSFPGYKEAIRAGLQRLMSYQLEKPLRPIALLPISRLSESGWPEHRRGLPSRMLWTHPEELSMNVPPRASYLQVP